MMISFQSARRELATGDHQYDRGLLALTFERNVLALEGGWRRQRDDGWRLWTVIARQPQYKTSREYLLNNGEPEADNTPMTSTHHLTWHEADRVLEIQLFGLWTDDDFAAFRTDMFAYAQANAAGRPFVVLSDAREYAAQPPSVAALWGDLMHAGTQAGVRGAVEVTTRAVQQMQRDRLLREAIGADAGEGGNAVHVSSIADGWVAVRALAGRVLEPAGSATLS